MTTQAFTLTDNAAKRVAFLLAKETNPNTKMRVAVDGGGCSGFQYKFDFDAEQHDDDVLIEKNGATVVIDSMSLDFVKGSQLDYIESLGGAHFEINNPNATAQCGCGNSFSV